ncbi:MAG: homocysteine S-methyltransferase [Gemmatimonadaceae bacterium]|nr:homocysteine S-methyltransferase [Gemmatimonadaceae bacterium]
MAHESPFAPFIAQRGIAIVDGALATELEARGADLHDPLWSARVLLEQPELIRAVHDAYFASGADVAITATYQATFEGFARRGIDASAAADLMQLAVRIACESRDAHWLTQANVVGAVKPLVAASVGPYGAFLADGSEYRGDYALDEDALIAWHAPRFRVLAESGADLLACETTPCAIEARAYMRLLDAHPTARAWITFSARSGTHISSGESFGEIAADVGAHAQVVAVGINCTAPHFVPDLIRAARAATVKPIIVYPNSGETYVAGAGHWESHTARLLLADASHIWFDAGATIIGGCCRTTPADILALSSWAKNPAP